MAWTHKFRPEIDNAAFEYFNGIVGILFDPNTEELFKTDSEGNKTPLTDEEIAGAEAKLVELVAEYEAAQYAHQRAAAYPSMEEQADMQYWDSVNGTTTWADAIAAVKAQYPKPE